VTQELRQTPLHDRHVASGARMVPFAGWDMPVQYRGVREEHLAVRAAAGVFDVSHMGRFAVRGDGAHAALQRLLSNDLGALGVGDAQYTLLTNERGGIVDDLIAYRRADDFLLVVNAANREPDAERIRSHLSVGVELTDESEATSMLALQGPASLALLAGLAEGSFDAQAARPFTFGEATVAGVPCTVARTGYTGEDGVELIAPAGRAVELWDALVAAGAEPCGLAARDTLRLEVCYPLHGNDIGPDTNAIGAGLGWVCALQHDFAGADVLRETKAAGPASRLVALRMTERAIPRQGCAILAGEMQVGAVTSGTMSPSLGEGIGLGWVDAADAAVGTALVVDVRGRRSGAEVAKKPFYRKEA
jgi:aminomethyltransferase